jgi:hypothetical protein
MSLIQTTALFFQKLVRKIKLWSTRYQVYLVPESLIEEILRKYGYWDRFRSDECVCDSCGKVVNLENLEAWIVSNGELHFICDDPQCMHLVVHQESKDG